VNDVVPLLGISHFFVLSTLGEPQKGHFVIVQYLKVIDVVYNLGGATAYSSFLYLWQLTGWEGGG